MREVASILEKTSDLINTIKNSSIYTEYHSALEDLNMFPDLKAMADEFRKAKFEAYHSETPIRFTVFDELEEKREKLAEYPQIDRFLKAELALGRILQEVQSQITEAMGLD